MADRAGTLTNSFPTVGDAVAASPSEVRPAKVLRPAAPARMRAQPFRAPSISFLKGAASAKRFAANPVTVSLTVPIAGSPGHSGFAPGLRDNVTTLDRAERLGPALPTLPNLALAEMHVEWAVSARIENYQGLRITADHPQKDPIAPCKSATTNHLHRR